MSYLPADLHDRLLEADNRHCAYYHTTEANTGQPMTVDHILPQAEGGETTFENLCSALLAVVAASSKAALPTPRIR